ncbi:MAG: serine hydrolase domain-containing protein [Bacteroidota bacterium]
MKRIAISSLNLGILLTISQFFTFAQTQPALAPFHEQMEKAQVVGYQILVIKEGQEIVRTSHGLRHVQQKDSINDSTLFVIASLSKPIIALGIMQLVERGLLFLDEPINPYLPFNISPPQFPDSSITPRMLLAHTSSIQDNWEVLGSLYRPDTPIKYELTLETFLRKYFLESGTYYSATNFHSSAPGEHFDYSNIGYMVLGHLIEAITQKKLKDYCREEIFEPLGMKHTFWYRQEIPHRNLASSHIIEEGKHIPMPHFGYPSYPEGQIRTTVSDYVKLILLFLHEGKVRGKEFLQASTLKEFLKIQYPEQNPWQATAWNLNEFGDEAFYREVPHLPAHTGLDPGASTAVMFDTTHKGAVIIFNNTQPTSFAPLLNGMKILAGMANIRK